MGTDKIIKGLEVMIEKLKSSDEVYAEFSHDFNYDERAEGAAIKNSPELISEVINITLNILKKPKILFRPQRGSLEDAMKEVIAVSSIEDLENIGEIKYYRNRGYLGEIKISHYCYDERIDWDTYIVTIGSNTSAGSVLVVGFTNGKIE